MALFRAVGRITARAVAPAGLRGVATSAVLRGPKEVTEEHIARAVSKDVQMSESYEKLAVDDPEQALAARRKRLAYRARQRGWLEVDLILGTWAHEHVDSLDERGLDEFEDVLRMETVDVYNWVTGRDEVPAAADNAVFRSLREFARTSPIGMADPKRYAEVKGVMSN